MAVSANQNQLRKHGEAVRIPVEPSPAARSIALSSWINLDTRRSGEECLGDRYLRIGFEDLCERPVRVVELVLRFFGLHADRETLAAEVAPPPSIGRWRTEDAAVIAELERVGGHALRELGYGTV